MDANLARNLQRVIIGSQLFLIYALAFCICGALAHMVVVVQLVIIQAVTGTLPKPTPRVQNWTPQLVYPHKFVDPALPLFQENV